MGRQNRLRGKSGTAFAVPVQQVHAGARVDLHYREAIKVVWNHCRSTVGYLVFFYVGEFYRVRNINPSDNKPKQHFSFVWPTGSTSEQMICQIVYLVLWLPVAQTWFELNPGFEVWLELILSILGLCSIQVGAVGIHIIWFT